MESKTIKITDEGQYFNGVFTKCYNGEVHDIVKFYTPLLAPYKESHATPSEDCYLPTENIVRYIFDTTDFKLDVTLDLTNDEDDAIYQGIAKAVMDLVLNILKGAE